MNFQLDTDNTQLILVVGIDMEKATFENMIFRVEEIEEGIISFLTIKEIEELIKGVIPTISEEEYDILVKNKTPLLYLVYDIEEASLFLSCDDIVYKVNNYENFEKRILKSAGNDFSILI